MTDQELRPFYNTKAHKWRIRRKQSGKWKLLGEANYSFRDFVEVMKEINKLKDEEKGQEKEEDVKRNWKPSALSNGI